jgi:hypothetical protein
MAVTKICTPLPYCAFLLHSGCISELPLNQMCPLCNWNTRGSDIERLWAEV